MHSFSELVDRSTTFTLNVLREFQDRVVEELQTSGATRLVKSLQMIQLQKAVMAVGIFSIFESMLQDEVKGVDGFLVVREQLDSKKCDVLRKRFDDFANAINVLKHGRGRSYELLVAQSDSDLPFR